MKDQDLYRYYSTCLICGENSPRLKEHDIFKSDFMRKKIGKDLHYKEKYVDGHCVNRILSIHTNFILCTSHMMGNDISRIISLFIESHNILVYDNIVDPYHVLLEEYRDAIIKSIIDKTKVLISVLREGLKNKLPLLINDFPLISSILLENIDALNEKVE